MILPGFHFVLVPRCIDVLGPFCPLFSGPVNQLITSLMNQLLHDMNWGYDEFMLAPARFPKPRIVGGSSTGVLVLLVVLAVFTHQPSSVLRFVSGFDDVGCARRE